MDLLILLFAIAAGKTVPVLDLKALGSDQFAVVSTGSKLTVTRYRATAPDTPIERVDVVAEGPLTRSYHTPEGAVTAPAYVLIGADQKRLFFQRYPAGIGIYDVATRTMTSMQLRHYDSVGQIWPMADKLLAATEMVTRTSSKLACERSYFTWLDGSGNVLTCYGEGKPFLDAFSDGDIPTVAYRPHSQESIIYYRKSGEMFVFPANGEASHLHLDHRLVRQLSEQATPEHLFALAADLVLVKRTPQAVSVFKLEDKSWTLQGRFEGSFTASIALSGRVVMLGKKGNLVSFPLASVR